MAIFYAINTNPVILRTKHYHTFVLTKIVGPFKYIQKSPPANAHTFADGDFRLITPATATFIAAAIRKTQRGCHAAAYSSSLSCVWIYAFSEVLLRIVVGFKKSIIYKRAYKVHLGPLRPSLEKSLCPKSCSSTRAAPRPWEQLLGSAPEETGNVC